MVIFWSSAKTSLVNNADVGNAVPKYVCLAESRIQSKEVTTTRLEMLIGT